MEKNKALEISQILKKKNFIFLEKHMNHSVALFSNAKCGDYLFIDKNYYNTNKTLKKCQFRV